MRLRTKDKLAAMFAFALLTFGLPLLTAIPVIASIAVLHHGWWSTIPLMGYWTAYWWQVTVIGTGLLVGLVVGKVKEVLF